MGFRGMHNRHDTLRSVFQSYQPLTLLLTGLGYDQGVFGGIIITQDFLDAMGNPDAGMQGTIVSLYDIGWCVV